jgi:uncharacterized protein YbjT (DUF2867 family)
MDECSSQRQDELVRRPSPASEGAIAMYAVAGVTGNTGSVVARTLLDRGHAVRAIVRNPAGARHLADRGATIAVASLDDEERLAGALEGVAGAYLLVPPDPTSSDLIRDGRRVADVLARAVATARVPHVVLLSSVAAHHAAGTGPIVAVHHAERALAATGAAVTFVRAAYFLDNLASLVPVARAEGVLPALFATDQRIPMVSTRDIGRVAAEALLAPATGRRVIELAGARDASFDDVAGVLAELLRRDVRAVRVPAEAVVPTLVQTGMSPDLARLYREMSDGLASGLVAFEGAVPVTRGTVGLAEALAPLAA